MVRRVVITGIGPVTAIGSGASFWEALLAGTAGFREITHFPLDGYKTRIAAEVPDGSTDPFIPDQLREELASAGTPNAGRALCYGLAAARLASDDAGLHTLGSEVEPARIGTRVGTASADLSLAVAGKPTPALLAFGGPGAVNSRIARELGLRGPSSTLYAGCGTGAANIAAAAADIQHGRADGVRAGSAAAPIASPLPYALFDNAASERSPLSRRNDLARPARPYDRKRDGYLLGEAACVLVLEELERALARNAPIYAEFLSFSEAYDPGTKLADVTTDGYVKALKGALGKASALDSQPVALIGYGSGLRRADAVECAAYRSALGGALPCVTVTAVTGQLGHCQEASSALSLATAALALQSGALPALAGLEEPDPAFAGIRFARALARGRYALAVMPTTSIDGIYTATVLKRFPQ